MLNLYKPVSAVYNAAKYAATHRKESVVIAAFGGLGALLAACGGNKEATPLEIATITPPSEPGATVQAPHDLTQGAYGLAPIPIPDTEQPISDLASKSRKLAEYVRTIDINDGKDKGNIHSYGWGNCFIQVKREVDDNGYTSVHLIARDGLNYVVSVRPDGEMMIYRASNETDPIVLATDFDLDGKVDYAYINPRKSNVRGGTFDRSKLEGLELEKGSQELHEKALEDLIRFYEYVIAMDFDFDFDIDYKPKIMHIL